MSNKITVLLVIDFVDANFPSALYALQQWSEYASKSQKCHVILGPTTSLPRTAQIGMPPALTGDEATALIRRHCPGRTIVRWDSEVEKVALGILGTQTARPFYGGFNYGSAVNRWLLLANESDCEYLIRVDPGTRPPEEKSFDQIVEQHTSRIQESGRPVVVSRGYKGRLAIRDVFLRDGQAKNQYGLVKKMTHIDPENQVTGGAMFTARVPGIPAIPFERFTRGGKTELTLVWASDDGLFQLLPAATGSEKLAGCEIPRFDAVGKPKFTIEYYRGVAGMVALAAFMRSQNATTKIEEFISTLIPLLDEEKCRENDKLQTPESWRLSFTRTNIAPDEFIRSIGAGLTNHERLLKEWGAICNSLKGKLKAQVQFA